MNLPNKITLFRIVLSICTLALLLIPWYHFGLSFPTFSVAGKVVMESKYFIAGVLFVFASLTDIFDGYLARSKNMVTDFGKVMDAIADKILVNGILILLAQDGFISVLIPIVIITRDTIVDSIKCVCASQGKIVGASKMAKVKTILMMIGVSFMLFYNVPFELVRLPFADIFIYLACILSIVSGCEYYYTSKNLLFKKNNSNNS